MCTKAITIEKIEEKMHYDIESHLRIRSKEELIKLLDKADPFTKSHPLPRCSKEVVDRFVNDLKMCDGVICSAYFGEIKNILTFDEFRTLFERLGWSLIQFAARENEICDKGYGCTPRNNYTCNPDTCA